MTKKTQVLWPGHKVRKVKGYRFPGEVRAAFLNLKGEVCYVVACTALDTFDMLHIYSGEQLERIYD